MFSIAVSIMAGGCTGLKEEAAPQPKLEKEEIAESLWLQNGPRDYQVDPEWWRQFTNEELNSIIATALKDSSDLKIMHYRLRLAEQQVALGKAAMRPISDFNVSQTYSKSSEGSSAQQSKLSGGLSWELDIWGKLSKMQQGALADYNASEADWRATCLQVVARTTSSYFQVRQYDELLQIHNEALKISERVQTYYKDRFEAGLEGEEKFKSQLAESLRLKANISDIKRQRALAVNQLAAVIGKIPGQFELPEKPLRTSTSQIALPEKLSANLLERRPDLIAAELRIKSAWLSKEAARAATLPEVSFSLSGESSAETISKLSGNWLAVFLPKVRFPALNPQTRINVEKQRITLETRQEEYRQAVINAVGEVEGALINLSQRKQQFGLEQKRLDSLLDAQKQSEDRFEGGLITQIEVLNYQQQVLSSRQQMLSLYSLLLNDSVTLHNALGGSW